MDIIKKRVESGKYIQLENFLNDFTLMFNNAKEYNVEGSRVLEDATILHVSKPLESFPLISAPQAFWKIKLFVSWTYYSSSSDSSLEHS